jgi:hypothetical protein
MIGINLETCMYDPLLTIAFYLLPDYNIYTLQNTFGMPCGYYTEYEWQGANDVQFQIESNSSFTLQIGIMFLLGLLNFI